MILALSMGDIRTFSLPVLPAFAEVFISVIYTSGSRSSSGSLAKNCGDALRLAAREQLAAESATRLLFEIYIGEGLPVQGLSP